MQQVETPPDPKIPLLTGITKDETKKACQGQFKDQILNKLKTVPNFLDTVLVSKLQKGLSFGRAGSSPANGTGKGGPSLGGLFSVLDPLQFTNYLKVGSLGEGLDKISEVTGDALFNVPAFLTADAWTRGGSPAFLYRFEHAGRRRKGQFFLKGLPLVGNSTQGRFKAQNAAICQKENRTSSFSLFPDLGRLNVIRQI